MIFYESNQIAASNLGWIDKGALWIYDGRVDKQFMVQLSDANYLTIIKRLSGFFAVVHHFDNGITISAHHFYDPSRKLVWTSYPSSGGAGGDPTYWRYMPDYYTAGFKTDGHFAFHLLCLKDDRLVLDDEKISWYHQGSFDFMYQGLTGVYDIRDDLLFTVQRDGGLYRFDKNENRMVERLGLDGGSGNPFVYYIPMQNELWISNGDYLNYMGAYNWKILISKQFQDPTPSGSKQFVGRFTMAYDLTFCVLSRPFSGDVISMADDMKINGVCQLGKQPLEAMLMKNGQVIGRDWKTGELLKGEMVYEKKMRKLLQSNRVPWFKP
jgi:hypothetical protein